MRHDAGKTRLIDAGALTMTGLLDRFGRAVRGHRRPTALAAYAGLAALAYLGAWLLRYGTDWPAGAAGLFLTTLPVLLTIRVATDVVFRLSTGQWRFVSTRDVLRLGAATTSGTLVFLVLTRLLPFTSGLPTSIVLIEWVLTGYLTAGVWIAYRTLFERIRHYRSGYNGSAKRVLIVGAGEAGAMLTRELWRFPTGYRPIGFVDDDAAKWGTLLTGLEVFGSVRELPRIARAQRAAEIMIAVPSATPEQLQRIVAACEAAALPFRVLPGIAEVLRGDVRLNHLRNVRLEDLLGREPVELDLSELDADLRGNVVLITGAAGSIGAELARQVARYSPSRLILLDQAETDLFYLELELRERYPKLEMAVIVGDIVDEETIEQLFEREAPARVFHAAAYKHVPVMETNAREAVRNNVLGTYRVADAAGRHGAGKFVLVSTDKAAQPANVMGATKRLAEMVILDLQRQYEATMFTAVRFGNVLGSNGSVVPIFQKQIRAGKPLTVTHPEATRYFMTMTEAVQLILQSSLLSEVRGNIAMLEMGEPVRMIELAENLLRLAGAPSRNGDSIVFTGLRPGEKLHEELVAPDEQTRPTAVPKVHVIKQQEDAGVDVRRQLLDWGGGFAPDDGTVLAWLSELFPGVRGDAVESLIEEDAAVSGGPAALTQR